MNYRPYKKPSVNWIGKQIIVKGGGCDPYTIKSISKNEEGEYILSIQNYSSRGNITLKLMFELYYWHRYKRYKGVDVVCSDICGIKEELKSV